LVARGPPRRRGIGRRLLRALEARAAEAGHTHVRLLTTPMLSEACVLYAAEGYVEIDRLDRGEGPVEIWQEKALR
jgi:GNAT superfamily N-acetyltransferase